MPNRLEKTPLVVYTPAVPAVPSRPPYCVTERVYAKSAGNRTALRLSGTNSNSSSKTDDAMLADARAKGWDGVGSTISFTSPQRPSYTTKQTCYPGVPGKASIPSRVNTTSNTGWNAGGRSRYPVPQYGYFRATLPASPIATMVGLADAGYDHSYNYMPVALVLRPGGYTMMEYGVDKTPETPIAPGATLEIQRREGLVVFLLNGAEVYTAETIHHGELYAAASLYGLSDSVDSPSLGSLAAPAQFDATLPPLTLLAADTDVMLFDGELPGLVLEAELAPMLGLMQLDATLPALVLLAADQDVMLFDGALPAPKLEASLIRPEAVESGLFATLPALTLSAFSMAGGSMDFDATLPPLTLLAADTEVMLLDAVLPLRLELTVGEPYLEDSEADGSVVMLARDSASLETALLLVAMDSMGVGGIAELTIVMELVGMDSLSVAENASFGQLVEMLAMEQVAINSHTSAARQQALQYAVNALTGAPTKYEGFDFSSFATVDGITYGLKPDGLYRIGGDTDDGEVLRALVDFGTTDYGDSHVKRSDMAYLGVRTDGECYLRVRADEGADVIYRVEGDDNMRRARLAKGVCGRFWSLRLELTDATFAEVDSLEVAVGVTQRRTFGRKR